MICNHFFVDGFGGMGDALVCKLCGLDKYPESMPLAVIIATLQGRIIRENNSEWLKHANEAIAARKRAQETS